MEKKQSSRPILVRLYRKRQTNQRAAGKGGKLERKQTGQATAKQYRTRPQLALEMIQIVAGWIPQRMLRVLADSEYAGQSISRHLPPTPRMWRPDLRAKVSSTAATKTPVQEGNSSWKTQWPRSSRFQRAWLKKRWKEQKCLNSVSWAA
jgi:hypothetical protein